MQLGDIEANADKTDADNVLSAGVVMTSGAQTFQDIKTFSSTIQGDISGNAVTVTNGVYTTSSVTALSDVSDAGSGQIITMKKELKLGDIEANADKTDADNVLSAGAVMTSGAQTIADIKTFSSTIQGDISGNAVTVTNGVYTTSSVTALSDVTNAGSGSIITDAERNKLGDIEANADVTDADNVLSAGAVMTSGNQTIAGTKTFSSTIQGDISGNAVTVTNGVYTTSSVTALSDVTNAGMVQIITDAERIKLGDIEANADVTDADNVLSAGAVMTSGAQTIAGY